MKISWHMIVRDEEKVIGRCLDSIAGLWDQLVVVDTGSSDRTREICRERGAEVHDFVWCDDFSAARNFALDKCKYEIVGWCDADDVISIPAPEARRQVLEVFQEGADGINVPYIFSHIPKTNKAALQFCRVRFFRRGRAYWAGRVHEYPATAEGFKSKTISTFVFDHWQEDAARHTGRNLRILEQAVQEPTPRDLFYYAKELTYHQRWKDALEAFQKYLPVSSFPPEKHRAVYEISHCYYMLKDNTNARHWALMAIEMHQGYVEPYNMLGRIAADSRQWAEAKAWFQHALTLPPPSVQWFDYVYPRTIEPLEWLAICEWYLGNKRDAYRLHSQAKQHNPNDPWLHQNDFFFVAPDIRTKPAAPILLRRKPAIRAPQGKYKNAVVSLLCPCWNRPEGAVRLYYTAREKAARLDKIEILFAVEECDPMASRYKAMKIPIIWVQDKWSSAKLNRLFRESQGDILGMVMDDTIVATDGWDEAVRASVPDDGVFVGYPKTEEQMELCLFPFVTRKVADAAGFFAFPRLNHSYIDGWWQDVGKRVGRLVSMADVFELVHAHYVLDEYHDRRTREKAEEFLRERHIFQEDSVPDREALAEKLLAMKES